MIPVLRFFLLVACLEPSWLSAAIVVRDDLGHVVKLEERAQRIVSLAPSITELVFAAGAGSRLVGVADYSDYPGAAKRIRRIGGSGAIDVETVAALAPDLVLAWKTGNAPGQIGRILSLGIPVYFVEPARLADLPGEIETLGRLAGTSMQAASAASAFRMRYAALEKRYAGRQPVRVFYEIWNNPLMTVNDAQFIGQVLRLCGAVNVFGSLPSITPVVSVEAVLRAKPQLIIASAENGIRPPWLDDWRRWPGFDPGLEYVHADLINREGPRILDGAETMCGQIDAVRRASGL